MTIQTRHSFGTRVAGSVAGRRPAVEAALSRADGDATIIEAVDPAAAMSMSDSPEVATVAGDVRARLQRVLAAVEATT